MEGEDAALAKFGGGEISSREMKAFFRLPLAALAFDLPAAFALHFDAQDSRDDDFARHGIVCPPSIALSVPKRRAEFLAGRRCAFRALRDLGCSIGDLPIGPDRAPVWPSGFLGSITHAGTIAAAVAAPAGNIRGIGIDIECVATGAALDALETTVIVAAERGLVDTLSRSLGRAEALTLVFSAKESFFKATAKAVGRIFDFQAVHIAGLPQQGLLEFEVAEDLATDLPAGHRMQASVTRLDEHTLMTACVW